jgi:orotate phosphoribosyltransferase
MENIAIYDTHNLTMEDKLTTEDKIAEKLLSIGAIQINVKNPFTWVSGIKSPIYCDNRQINSNVAVRDLVVCAFVDFIHNIEGVDIIAGVATGGIPLGTLIADRLKLPFIYVRSEPKKHGLMKQVEGYFKKGDKVILIEDHISTGSSSMKAIKGLKEAGLDLICLISNMTYGFDKAEKLFNDEGIKHYSICNLETILKSAVRAGIINEDEKNQVIKFKSSPETWYDNLKS